MLMGVMMINSFNAYLSKINNAHYICIEAIDKSLDAISILLKPLGLALKSMVSIASYALAYLKPIALLIPYALAPLKPFISLIYRSMLLLESKCIEWYDNIPYEWLKKALLLAALILFGTIVGEIVGYVGKVFLSPILISILDFIIKDPIVNGALACTTVLSLAACPVFAITAGKHTSEEIKGSFNYWIDECIDTISQKLTFRERLEREPENVEAAMLAVE
jgi:hypothetical protein